MKSLFQELISILTITFTSFFEWVPHYWVQVHLLPGKSWTVVQRLDPFSLPSYSGRKLHVFLSPEEQDGNRWYKTSNAFICYCGQEGQNSLFKAVKKKTGPTKISQRHMQQKSVTLLKKEVQSSGGFSCVKVKTVCMKEGRKNQVSWLSWIRFFFFFFSRDRANLPLAFCGGINQNDDVACPLWTSGLNEAFSCD